MKSIVRSFQALTLLSVMLCLMCSLVAAQPPVRFEKQVKAAQVRGDANWASYQRVSRRGDAEAATQKEKSSELSEKMTGKNAAKPSGSHLSEQQTKNVQKLQADLNSIKQGSQVTQDQVNALKADLMAMADGATKPDQALVQKLAIDLANAIADGKLTSKEKAQLSQDLYAVMNSANIPTSEVNQAIADAQTIFTASGITKEEVTVIVSDLKAIAAEAKSNLQTAGSKFKGKKPTKN